MSHFCNLGAVVVAFLLLLSSIMSDRMAVAASSSSSSPASTSSLAFVGGPSPASSVGRRRKDQDASSTLSLLLVPSQVGIPSRTTTRSKRDESKKPVASRDGYLCSLFLVPSQVVAANTPAATRTSPRTLRRGLSRREETELASQQNTTFYQSENRQASSPRRNKARSSRTRERTNNGERETAVRSNNRRPTRMLSGDLPDIHWRAVPMDHLRAHPHFDPLPVPEAILSLDSLEDVRNFRQDSWQWDALHEGRCTTSQAVAALGLLEPQAGKALSIPSSWRRGGVSAYYRLRKRALRSLDEMNEFLCQGSSSGQERPWRDARASRSSRGLYWTIPKVYDATRSGDHSTNRRYPFAAKYLPRITPQERQKRRQNAERYAANGMFMSVRMSWGNSQEATALLCALNYFWKEEPDIRLQEVGMCGAGLDVNRTDVESSLLIGATPDGILVYPDGKVEVLEVKNHCPFVPATWGRDSATTERYSVRQLPFRDPTVPPLYIPQLMMEMLSVGPECRSAVMVRLTATNGAVILRLHRDDAWIEEMLFWLHKFQRDYVESEVPPPTDFFWTDETYGERYQKFVEWTNELGSGVDVVDQVKHNEVQRVLATHRNITSLFLD